MEQEEGGKFLLNSRISEFVNNRGIFVWYGDMKFGDICSICIITVAGETRVACVRLGMESSIFEFGLCSPCCCCCEEDAPTEVDAVVDDDEEELEAPCCP